jgi:uncharacterized protein DUF4112
LRRRNSHVSRMRTIEIIPPGAQRDFRHTSSERNSSHSSRRAALKRIDVLSQLFDTAFILPGTNVRFGIEAILRLVPGIGDVAASALSAYLLYEAHRLEVPGHIFARLTANVAIEGIIGAVPLVGDLFDVGFKANRRNLKILKNYFEEQGLI